VQGEAMEFYEPFTKREKKNITLISFIIFSVLLIPLTMVINRELFKKDLQLALSTQEIQKIQIKYKKRIMFEEQRLTLIEYHSLRVDIEEEESEDFLKTRNNYPLFDSKPPPLMEKIKRKLLDNSLAGP
jgi:hypothetical protein